MSPRKKKVMVIAPHPDDETLGCGGTLLRHQCDGDELHWVIVTKMGENRFSQLQRENRQNEIAEVAQQYQFQSVHQLGFITTELSSENLGSLIQSMMGVITQIKPEVVYCPFYGDAHTDHYWAYRALFACTKSFRAPWVKKVLCYETISETDFGASHAGEQFLPQVFVDVSAFFDKKLNIMSLYKSEMQIFPAPRSREGILSLAQLRGVKAGVLAAEAFQLIKEFI